MRGYSVILVLLLCNSLYANLLAQISNLPLGGRALGMANTAVTVQDEWALFNNVGAMAWLQESSVMMAYDYRFNFSPFQTFGAGGTWVLKSGAMGLSLSRFGDKLYNEQKIGLAYAHKIENTSIGLKINYLQVSLENYGSRGNFVFELGGLTRLSKTLVLGAHIYNLTLAKIKSEFNEITPIPIVMKAGLSYQPVSALLLNIETEKDIDLPARLKLGVEYQLIKHIFLRTGLQTHALSTHFGVGFQTKKWRFNYAIYNQSQLGASHQFALSFVVNRSRWDRF
jgi:hypothetical protein